MKAPGRTEPPRPLVRPARLAPGARVAVVAPSGPVAEERLESGLDLLRGWDLDPVLAPHARGVHGDLRYLAGTDAERAADLERAWCDPSVDAVLCARGGYGAQRIADLLDWEAMRAAGPKVFVGFSDSTALHEAFAVRLGLVTLYGPVTAGADFVKNAHAREHLRATLFTPEAVRTLTGRGSALVPGRARGVTLGGCLALLATGTGTPHTRSAARGGLVLVEDVAEAPYAVDRSLTHLLRSGRLDGAAGIVLGSWDRCGPYEELRPVLADRLGGLGIPVAEEFGFGHCDGALTVPLGVAAELDAEAGTLTLDQPALR
ncbi:S66 peptidase family protein [Streptomyces sp. MS06]|uniref:S66 peptidase family protein n=1 Tax=Streptomyces sp. MS06 TaxID=3385974 RepID=UPI0039A3E0B4